MTDNLFDACEVEFHEIENIYHALIRWHLTGMGLLWKMFLFQLRGSCFNKIYHSFFKGPRRKLINF